MSFLFPNYPNLPLDEKLMENPEPDYDLLLVRLSLYAFNRVSPSDQRDQVEGISRRVKAEDVQFLEESDGGFREGTFAEIFKKLSFSDQLEVFLSKVIQKFKRERLRKPVEMFRLREFTRLSGDYTDHVNKRRLSGDYTDHANKRRKGRDITEEQENGSNWAEFFLGFSVIWFQGQSASGQDMLIEQLEKGTKGKVVIGKRLQDESEEDFKLRRFTELCKKVVDFRVQEKFLEKSEDKLHSWGCGSYFSRLIGEPQDFDSAAELLCHLWTFGVSLLSAEHQQQKIEEMSKVESDVKTLAAAAAASSAEGQISTTDYHEESVRIRRLTELFNQVPVRTRIHLFQELRKTLSKAKAAKRYSDDSDPYDEFLFGVVIIWFKAKCADMRRNPIQLILFGEVESGLGDTIEKLPEESEGDFRLRRFKESFKQLEFTSQELVLGYIQNTTFIALDYQAPLLTTASTPSEERSSFDSKWINLQNYKSKNPRDQVAATPRRASSRRSTGAAVRQQGTSQPSLVRK